MPIWLPTLGSSLQPRNCTTSGATSRVFSSAALITPSRHATGPDAFIHEPGGAYRRGDALSDSRKTDNTPHSSFHLLLGHKEEVLYLGQKHLTKPLKPGMVATVC